MTVATRRATAAEFALSRLALGLIDRVRRMPWRKSLGLGLQLGDLAHALRIRRRVADQNLALAFPDRSASERDAILRDHYRELGRVCVEYARLPELADSAPGEIVTEVLGREHPEAALARGRGAVLLTGHVCNFELAGAWLARRSSLPIDFVFKPLHNPAMEEWIAQQRRAAGVGLIPTGAGVRAVFAALKDNRGVALLGDQDARRHGVFVPFFGRLTSTASGPAALALRTGAPLIMAFDRRLEDGRHRIEFHPPLTIEDPAAPDAVERLTALHTAALEARIREHPADWFWLHRRWKTPPP
jgi:KDO2-lipid IV(A) lauroyltransferase